MLRARWLLIIGILAWLCPTVQAQAFWKKKKSSGKKSAILNPQKMGSPPPGTEPLTSWLLFMEVQTKAE